MSNSLLSKVLEWWCHCGLSSRLSSYYFSRIWYQYHQQCLPCHLWKLCFQTSEWQTRLVKEWSWYLFYHDIISAGHELHHPWNNSSYSSLLRWHSSYPSCFRLSRMRKARPLALSVTSSRKPQLIDQIIYCYFTESRSCGWWLMPSIMAMRNSEPWSTVDTQVAIGVAYLRRHISWQSVISTVWAAPWFSS